MKKFIYLFLLLTCFSAYTSAQTEYVPVGHPVYDYLERMNSQQLINYNSFELPKTRKSIGRFLVDISNKKNELNSIDIETLNLFLNEFQYDINGSTENVQSFFGESSYEFFNDEPRYLYRLTSGKNDSLKAAVFVNFITGSNNIYSGHSDIDDFSSYNTFGGIIRGTLLDHFGFYIKGTNGKVFGDHILAKDFNEVKYSLKAGVQNDPLSDMIDFTEGYLTVDYDLVKLKLGRDYKHIGYGNTKSFLSSNAQLFDYLQLDLNYKAFSFSYYHGQLLGTSSMVNDSIQGPINTITDKYVAYHRLGIDIFKRTNFGIGEITVYSNRNLDLSYLNPFTFHKSIEHANRDRDNSMLFVDLRDNSIKGLTISGSFLLDELKFERIGTDWWANKFVYDLNIYSSNLYELLPLDISLQYLRINPYTFTHRIHNNSYSSFNEPLNAPLQPNSHLASINFIYTPFYKLRLNAGYEIREHGANPLNPDGSLKENVGGDVLVGHRPFDSETAEFLAGNREVTRKYFIQARYQPYLNYYIVLFINRIDAELQNNEREKYFYGGLSISTMF